VRQARARAACSLIVCIRAVLRRTSGDLTALLRVADLELDPDGSRRPERESRYACHPPSSGCCTT